MGTPARSAFPVLSLHCRSRPCGHKSRGPLSAGSPTLCCSSSGCGSDAGPPPCSPPCTPQQPLWCVCPVDHDFCSSGISGFSGLCSFSSSRSISSLSCCVSRLYPSLGPVGPVDGCSHGCWPPSGPCSPCYPAIPHLAPLPRLMQGLLWLRPDQSAELPPASVGAPPLAPGGYYAGCSPCCSSL